MNITTGGLRRAVALTFGVALCAVPAAAAPVQVSILTQNMDEGTDYQALVAAGSPGAFFAAVTSTYNTIAATDPATRAAAMASEIARTQPTFVTLQEASLVRTSTSGPATTVTSDLLGSLTSSLNALGLHYAPVVIAPELDAQAPSTLGFNVRLTTQDVILARTDLPAGKLSVSNPQTGQFVTQLTVPTAVGPISLTRGWGSVDVNMQGGVFRLVTTHLDTGQFVPAIQFAQAQELLTGPGATSMPIVYAGDFNSDADNPADPTFPTYQSLIDSGLSDAWIRANPGDPGFTCCQSADLLNPDSTLSQRIDLMLLNGNWGVESASLLGISPLDRTAGGLWPSDHAGLLVTLDVPVPEPAPLALLGLGLAGLTIMRRRRAA